MAKRESRYEFEEEKPGNFERIRIKLKALFHFLSYDIWRQNPETLTDKRNILYNAIKTVILTVRNVQELDIAASARSLTYRTLLSIVPLLAILFAIARGFGIENIMESSIFSFMLGNRTAVGEVVVAMPESDSATAFFPEMGTDGMSNADSTMMGIYPSIDVDMTSNEVSAEGRTREFLDLLFHIIDNSLEEAKGGGLFAGIGILLFLYTILILFNDIERNLNKIWQVSKGRSIGRKVTDYTAMVLFMPVFFILVNALSIFSYPQNDTIKIIYILYPFIPRLLDIVPFVVMILLFTAIYKFLPNTKVKFVNALIAGIVAGIAFQFFQMLYLSGQMWITRYNAIYGTFAAIPLMLLWIQMSWFIVLIGAEVSYAAQNVSKFSFEKETRNISRRYRDFITLIISVEIVQRFAEELPPLTADQISVRCKVPGRLTVDILDQLVELNFLSVTPSVSDERVLAYQPARDIHTITVDRLLAALDSQGSEDFMIDIDGDYKEHWNALMTTRMGLYDVNSQLQLKDL